MLKLLKLDETEALLPPISDHFVAPQGQIYHAEGAARYHVALLAGCAVVTDGHAQAGDQVQDRLLKPDGSWRPPPGA